VPLARDAQPPRASPPQQTVEIGLKAELREHWTEGIHDFSLHAVRWRLGERVGRENNDSGGLIIARPGPAWFDRDGETSEFSMLETHRQLGLHDLQTNRV